MKLPGRVGDSAIPGAGLYAESHSGAVSATGAGEEIIRLALCKTISDLMRSGMNAQAACDAGINLLTGIRGPGTAGVVAVDTQGGFGVSRNTEMMPVSLRFESQMQTTSVVLPEDYEKSPILRSTVTSLKKLKM